MPRQSRFRSSPPKKPRSLHLIPVVFTAGEDPGRVAQKISIRTDQGERRRYRPSPRLPKSSNRARRRGGSSPARTRRARAGRARGKRAADETSPRSRLRRRVAQRFSIGLCQRSGSIATHLQSDSCRVTRRNRRAAAARRGFAASDALPGQARQIAAGGAQHDRQHNQVLPARTSRQVLRRIALQRRQSHADLIRRPSAPR